MSVEAEAPGFVEVCGLLIVEASVGVLAVTAVREMDVIICTMQHTFRSHYIHADLQPDMMKIV